MKGLELIILFYLIVLRTSDVKFFIINIKLQATLKYKKIAVNTYLISEKNTSTFFCDIFCNCNYTIVINLFVQDLF